MYRQSIGYACKCISLPARNLICFASRLLERAAYNIPFMADPFLSLFHLMHWALPIRYAFPTIAIDFFYQVTLFIAILVLDERRIADQREDICICTKRPVLQIDNLGVDDNHGDVLEDTAADGLGVHEKPLIDRIMAKYAKFLMRPIIKGIVVVIFAYFFALCVYRTTLLTQEFNITELFPTGSYASRVLNAIQTYQERSLQVEIYFRNVNQSDPVIQSQMLQFVDDIKAMASFEQGPPLCWVRDFQLLRETEYFSLVEKMTFEEQVVYALSIPAIKEAYGMDIVHNNGTISASRCIIVMKNEYLESVAEQISVLRDQRAITGAQPINEGLQGGSESFFTFNQVGTLTHGSILNDPTMLTLFTLFLL